MPEVLVVSQTVATTPPRSPSATAPRCHHVTVAVSASMSTVIQAVDQRRTRRAAARASSLAARMRYFRRRWDESRGDRFDHWGAATYLFEVDPTGLPLRQLEVYDNGMRCRYDREHPEDQYGSLSAEPLESLEDWSPWAITRAEFEREWRPA